MKLTIADVLHQYSEFLDGEGLIRGEEEKPDDNRSHDQLVAAFLESQLENQGRNYEQLEIEFTDEADEGIGYAEAMMLQGDRVSPLPSGHTRRGGGMATRELRGNV